MIEDVVTEVTGTETAEELLTNILFNSAFAADYLRIIAGLLIFFAVVVLCYFVYKFFRIFI